MASGTGSNESNTNEFREAQRKAQAAIVFFETEHHDTEIIKGDAHEDDSSLDTSFAFGNNSDEDLESSELIEACRQFKEASVGAPDTAEMLEAVRSHITRYCVLSGAQATACAAWVLHTWVISTASKSPYLLIQAAERACGKTTLLDCLSHLAFDPLSAGAATGAALVRALNERPRTLFLDEIDILFAGDSETAQAVAGVLNCGYQRGKKFLKCDGKENAVREFDPFGAKALSGISGNKLPESTISRCVPIEMRRKLKSESVSRFVERDYGPRSRAISADLAKWSAFSATGIGFAQPPLINELSDRQNDAIEPLLAIASIAGETWPSEVRAALVELFAEASAAETGSAGENLLFDIHGIFDSKRREVLSSHDLIAALCELEESPWSEWNRGKPLSPRQLASRLGRFGIKPHLERISGNILRGYRREEFGDAWKRYLPAIQSTV